MDPLTLAIVGSTAGSALMHLFGAHTAADAAKAAAKQQQTASQHAQLASDQAYTTQMGLMDPYVRAGQMSLAALQARKFGGTADQYLPSQPPATSNPLTGNARAIADAYQTNLGRQPSLAEIQTRLSQPNFDPLKSLADVPTSPEAQAYAANGRPASNATPVSFPNGAPSSARMVMVMSPDGREFARIPEGPQLDQALRAGARRLG